MAQQYVVMHTGLDTYFQGQVISVDHLKGGRDIPIDIDRLLRLGAIAPVGSRQADDMLTELGPDATTPEQVPIGQEVPLPLAPDGTAKSDKAKS